MGVWRSNQYQFIKLQPKPFSVWQQTLLALEVSKKYQPSGKAGSKGNFCSSPGLDSFTYGTQCV